MTVRVAVDAMGGDRGPDEIVQGALEASRDGIVPVVFGPAALDTRGLEHVVAEQVVAMDEKPAEAVRSKPRSSWTGLATDAQVLDQPVSTQLTQRARPGAGCALRRVHWRCRFTSSSRSRSSTGFVMEPAAFSSSRTSAI